MDNKSVNNICGQIAKGPEQMKTCKQLLGAKNQIKQPRNLKIQKNKKNNSKKR